MSLQNILFYKYDYHELFWANADLQEKIKCRLIIFFRFQNTKTTEKKDHYIRLKT